MSSENQTKITGYTKYPISSILNYNTTTLLHYLLGGYGIILGFNFSSIAIIFGILYTAYSLIQMYILMPLMVCPNCVYYKLENSLCISGMNIFSKKIAEEGKIENFGNRGKGLFCHNNLYMAAKVVPIIAMIPALIINFSFPILIVFVLVVGLFVYRIFILFPKVACIHCRAAYTCPNAIQMGIK